MLTNTSLRFTNHTKFKTYDYLTDRYGCNIILAGNSSFAANWENIPETLLLNGVIGIILFVIFLILTYIAWRQADSDDRLKNQNIVSFLYGYRDPEQWYVIPRFEFLRHEDRHHQHDLNYPYLYAPPKLPLANPLEILANHDNEPELSKSIDSNQDKPAIDPTKLPADPRANFSSLHSPTGGPPKSNGRESKIETNAKDERKSRGPNSQADLEAANSKVNGGLELKELSQKSTLAHGSKITSPNRERRDTLKSSASFFFPSILTAEQLQASSISRKLNRFFAIFFRVSDADIIYARGIDAYEYLLFQRHLILILVITNVLCLGILLPIHWFGGAAGISPNLVITSFQRSTIKNLQPESAHLHWAHIFCAFLIVACSLRILGSYRDSIITPNDQQLSRRTLLIGNIPNEQRSRSHLLKILKGHFPRHKIEAIQFVYDTASLSDDEMYLSSTIVAKDYCLAYKRKHNKEIYVRPTDVNKGRYCDGYCRCCSFLYICCCHWPYESKEPGSLYYAREEEFYRDKIAKSCEKLVKEPAEFAFVTFKTHRQARRVMQELANWKQDIHEGKSLRAPTRHAAPSSAPEHSPSAARNSTKRSEKAPVASKFLESGKSEANDPLDPKNDPHVRSIRSPGMQRLKQIEKNLTYSSKQGSSLGAEDSNSTSWRSHINEGPLMWSVRYAPHPDNIEFQDLLNLSRTSPFTIVLLHTLMVIIFIFITTPNVILSVIERFSVLRPQKAEQMTGFRGLAINFLSILLQIFTTALLPALVTLISKQIPYEDSSSKGHSVMWKVYLFLVLMVIVMPSIGMSSALALLDEGLDPKCLFPTDNGAYYVNYVISSTFISTMLELIKPSDILFYYFILWTSRSTAEIEGGRQFIEREFSVGLQHTTVLLIFSVVMTYAISCPLIAPVGLCYMMVKHSVDHYNLYYSYFTKKVDKDMQSTIVVFVRVALLLMLFQTTVALYSHNKTGYFPLLSLITQLIIVITLAALIINCFFDCTSRSVPPSNRRAKYQHDFCACFYLPKVISSLLRSSAIPANCISRKI